MLNMQSFTLPEHLGHVVSFSTYGNPSGFPILSFHGGPGSKSKAEHATRFDLSKYRVILFDQRGCGKSTPLGKLESNTTQNILNDVERIRNHLSIDSWFLCGGSWGSTCALLYAIAYPHLVKGLLLTSIFLANTDAIEWAVGPSGGARFAPEMWDLRMQFFKEFNIRLEHQSEDLLKAFETASLEEAQKLAAGILQWEYTLSSLHTSSVLQPSDMTESDIANARIAVHYAHNHYFIQNNYILDSIQKIQHIPTFLIHGRYDTLCPPEQAFRLQKCLSRCEYIFTPASGHRLSSEAKMVQQLGFEKFLQQILKEG